jgi:trk system potassium uptake protein TrkH
MQIIFEVISAFANVGLSTGITPMLTSLGKLIIIITMFIGRISPLTIALVVGKKEELPIIGYPVETVMVG